jgi:hypothetical protein
MFFPSELSRLRRGKTRSCLPTGRVVKEPIPGMVHKLPLECSQFEEALILAEESRLSTTTEWRKLRSHPPRESPEQTAAKPSLRPDTITWQASEFLRFRCEISVGRKNCPSRLEGISKGVSLRAIGDVPFCSART